MPQENSASEFLTNSHSVALCLYFLLQREGKSPRMVSGLITDTKNSRNYRLHRIYVDIPEKILLTYVQFQADKFPKKYGGIRWNVFACEVEEKGKPQMALPKRLHRLAL